MLKLNLDVVKMCHHTKMQFLCQGIQKTDTQTNRHTDKQTHRQNENITFQHTWAVKMKFLYEGIQKFCPNRHTQTDT